MRDQAPALRVYRGLLWLYPAEFRDHFAGEMCRALADCLRQRPDPVEVLWLYLGVLIDAPKERYHMIRQDVVYALRTMRREKLSSLVAMLVLALGIGSTATVFTLVNGMLLKPLPYPDQNRIVSWKSSCARSRASWPIQIIGIFRTAIARWRTSRCSALDWRRCAGIRRRSGFRRARGPSRCSEFWGYSRCWGGRSPSRNAARAGRRRCYWARTCGGVGTAGTRGSWGRRSASGRIRRGW